MYPYVTSRLASIGLSSAYLWPFLSLSPGYPVINRFYSSCEVKRRCNGDNSLIDCLLSCRRMASSWTNSEHAHTQTHTCTLTDTHSDYECRAGDSDDIKGIYGTAWPLWRLTDLRHLLVKNRHAPLAVDRLGQWCTQTNSHTNKNNQAYKVYIRLG